MTVYRCPDCNSRMDVKEVYDGRFLFKCQGCGIIHIISVSKKRLDKDESFMEFLLDYDEGKVRKSEEGKDLLESEGLVRTREEIAKMLEEQGTSFQGLPRPVSEALSSRTDYVVSYRLFKEQEPEPGSTPEKIGLHEGLISSLIEIGVNRLYRFQEEAIGTILEGEDGVIVAPTGSGKTEAFAVPVFQRLAGYTKGQTFGPRQVRALFIYPTKALARDQLSKLKRFGNGVGARVEVFDGDTPRAERERIVSQPPDAIVTNFDSLHHHMLHGTPLSRLLRSVMFVVVDEVHIYTGTFGTNVHFILRRLSRLCGGFQAIGASATISNPKEFCEMLFGRKVKVLSAELGRKGRIHFLMTFPTLRSQRSQVISITKRLAEEGYQTLVFSNSHLGAELNAFYGRREGIKLDVHRAGLLAKHRRAVEDAFRKGELRALSSTPTLELGIDIGTVDAVVSELANITRVVQRVGRVGRKGQESLAFLSLRSNDPISRYYKENPGDYFEDAEEGYIDPGNPLIARVQLLAASLDKPLSYSDFPDQKEVIDELVLDSLLIEKDGLLRPNYSAARRALLGYDIRGSGASVDITLDARKIGERSLPLALEELHPQAIYFLGGQRYRSKELVIHAKGGEAKLERLPSNYPYYTKPLLEDWPKVLKERDKAESFSTEILYCDLSIRKSVVGYIQREIGSESLKGARFLLQEPLEYEFMTKGIVFRAPPPSPILAREPDRVDYILPSSFHASEHVMIEGTNMVTGGVASDMGGISLGSTGLIFIYDASAGGNGATRVLFERFESAVRRAKVILETCKCTSESGCPRCTYSYRCGNNNDFLHRMGALEVLNRMVTGEPSRLGEFLVPEGVEKPIV